MGDRRKARNSYLLTPSPGHLASDWKPMNPNARLSRLLLSLACCSGNPAMAQMQQDPSWAFKDWRAFAEGPVRARQCGALTGGDGSPSLRVSAAASDEVAIFFAEPTSRGIRPAMKADDRIGFRLDDKRASVFEATVVNVGVDKDGIPYANAGLSGPSAAIMITAMRAATSVKVVSLDRRSGKQSAFHEFSLAGFTANFLKLSEWCGFDANRLKQS